MRWGSRVRSKAFLTIAACRDVVDVVEVVKCMYIPLSLISAARHPLHQAISLLLSVFLPKIGFMVKKYFLKLSFFDTFYHLPIVCFSDFFASIVLRNKNAIAEKSLFSLFISLFLFSFFLLPFFCSSCLAKEIWWQRHHLLMFLSLFFSPLYVHTSSLETWQKVGRKIGQPEAVELNPEDQTVCVEDPRKIVLEKQKICGKATPWLGRASKPSGR